MKIDFDQTINDLDDNPITQPNKQGVLQPLTLKHVAVEALMLSFRLNLTLPGREGLRRLKLAMMIDDAVGPLDLSEDDRQLIRDEVGEKYSTIVVGRTYELLGFEG